MTDDVNQEPKLLSELPDAAEPNLDAFFFGSEEKRNNKHLDLLERTRAVQTNGWDPYKYAWSTGEVVQVAYLLDDAAVLAEFGETKDDVISRTAGDLYGARGCGEDREAGYPKTKAWLREVLLEVQQHNPGTDTETA